MLGVRVTAIDAQLRNPAWLSLLIILALIQSGSKSL